MNSKRFAYKNFLLLFSIPLFKLLNKFRMKKFQCHKNNFIIFPSYSSLFLVLVWGIGNLKIPSVFPQQNFLGQNGSFSLTICSQCSHNWDIYKINRSINRKLLKKWSTERSIGLSLPFLSIGKASMISRITPVPEPKLMILFALPEVLTS